MIGSLTYVEIARDPIQRIGKLRSANSAPMWVVPETPLSEAVTIMLSQNYSQLPVMTSERDVKGVVSWASIASRMTLGVTCDQVRHCMDPAHIIVCDTSVFEAIDPIQHHQYALIRDIAGKIAGIVTLSDLAEEFKVLVEPFLLLGAIEHQIRWIIESGSFSEEELRAYKTPNDTNRLITHVTDFSLGECRRLLEDPKNWAKIGLAVDRKVFIQQLATVIAVRNEVMHFTPAGVSPDGMKTLQHFGKFLRNIVAVLSKK
jgi:predicted transcriptional regulator